MKIKILYCSLIMLLFASCNKEDVDSNDPNQGSISSVNDVKLSLAPQYLDGESTTPTFSSFEEDDDIRLGIYYKNDAGKLMEYAGIENTKIFGKLKKTSEESDALAWRFGYDYEGDLTGIGFKVDMNTDNMPYIAGCAPFSDGDDIQNIQYDVTNCDNYMMLSPVEIPIEKQENDKGVMELSKFVYDVDLAYEHTLAKLEIRVQHKQQTNSSSVDQAPFGSYPPYFWLIPNEDNKLVSKAKLDASTGVYSDMSYYQKNTKLSLASLRIIEYDENGWDISLRKTGLFKYDLYVLPIDDLGDGIQIALGYNKLTKPEDEELEDNESWITTSNRTYTDLIVNDKLIIDKSTIPSGKLERGHKYRIEMVIDNYFKIDNITVETEWTDKTNEPFTGEL